MQRVYLDNAATTAIAPEVIEVMLPFLQHQYGNPSSTHAHGREVKAAIELARKQVASFIHAQPSEIIFTSGGTESNNMAIFGAIRDLGIERIITSPIEHHCVLHTVEFLHNRKKIDLQHVRLLQHGNIDLSHLAEMLQNTEKKTLVSLMHANNEIGNVTDVSAVGELCKNHNAFFHVDSVQTMAHYPIDVTKMHVHFMSGAAHKFHGPKGVGFLYINNKSKIKPIIHGGSQERETRAGTENVYGIIGLAKAMEMAYSNLNHEMEYISGLKKYAIEKLQNNLKDFKINGTEDGLYTVLNFSFDAGAKADLLLFMLDMEGVSISGGSACNSGAEGVSHVIKSVYPNENRRPLRISFCRYTTKNDIDFFIEKLKKIVE